MGRYVCQGISEFLSSGRVIDMNKVLISLISLACVFLSGCVLAAKLGTPGRDEQIIPAEFKLDAYKEAKIAIVVRSGLADQQSQTVSYYLDVVVRSLLIANNKKTLKEKNFVPYKEFAKLKADLVVMERYSAVEIGKMLNADVVLEIEMSNCRLEALSGTGYYEGSLSLSGILYDVKSGAALWPEDGFSKQASVSFDIDATGRDGAMKRLAKTGGHCIARYFYDCPMPKFEIPEETAATQW